MQVRWVVTLWAPPLCSAGCGVLGGGEHGDSPSLPAAFIPEVHPPEDSVASVVTTGEAFCATGGGGGVCNPLGPPLSVCGPWG